MCLLDMRNTFMVERITFWGKVYITKCCCGCGLGGNQKIGGLIPGSSSPHVEVALSKLLGHSHLCMCACEYVRD